MRFLGSLALALSLAVFQPPLSGQEAERDHAELFAAGLLAFAEQLSLRPSQIIVRVGHVGKSVLRQTDRPGSSRPLVFGPSDIQQVATRAGFNVSAAGEASWSRGEAPSERQEPGDTIAKVVHSAQRVRGDTALIAFRSHVWVVGERMEMLEFWALEMARVHGEWVFVRVDSAVGEPVTW